jgi:threonine synthase
MTAGGGGTVLHCAQCGADTVELGRSDCERCGGILLSVCERQLARASSTADCRADGVWRFAAALPRVSIDNRVTLAEGGTPLLKGTGLIGDHAGLFLKDETRNPTGTFKDRIMAVTASVAREVGARGLVCASTGNAGASTAAYAARARLPALIVVPAQAPVVKLAQAIVCGATVVRVPGSYSDAYRVARELEKAGYVNATTTFISPYSVEGGRTVAYELVDDMAGSPDWIVVPIGAGPLLVGLLHGFAELSAAGRCRSVPRLLGVQPDGCAPIVRAIAQQADHVVAWGTPDTTVSSLADPLQGYEREGDITLEAIRASRGSGVAVGDADTVEWVRRLAVGTGVFAEPGGAIALAGAARAVERGLVTGDESIVCCVTGTGLKDPSAAVGSVDSHLVEAGSPEFERLLSRNDAGCRSGEQPGG